MVILSIGASLAKNIFLKMITVSSFIVFAFPVQAAQPLNVVINEIAWMGNTVSYNDEWIELYNNAETEINLLGWKLGEINLTGVIPPRGFYLLERTDDNAVSDIQANQIYTGAMDNKGENFALYDSLGNLIDRVDCSGGWFGGDNRTKQTMERRNSQSPGNDSVNWETSQDPGGTPKAENILATTLSSPAGTPTREADSPVKSEIQIGPIPVVYPAGIIINEILPSPDGQDAKEEWIELFNQNTFEIDLSGWRLSDVAGETKTYTFPEETIISANGFLIFPRPITKITLNNSEDGLELIRPDGKIAEEVKYENAPRGQSYIPTGSGWDWSSYPTPGGSNKTLEAVLDIREKTDSPESSIEIKFRAEQGMAAIGEQKVAKTLYNRLAAPLAASLIAILSGVIILILKIKLQEKRNLLI